MWSAIEEPTAAPYAQSLLHLSLLPSFSPLILDEGGVRDECY